MCVCVCVCVSLYRVVCRSSCILFFRDVLLGLLDPRKHFCNPRCFLYILLLTEVSVFAFI